MLKNPGTNPRNGGGNQPPIARPASRGRDEGDPLYITSGTPVGGKAPRPKVEHMTNEEQAQQHVPAEQAVSDNDKKEAKMRVLTAEEMDAPVPEQFEGNFIPKDVFVNRRTTVRSLKVSKNQFDRYILLLADVKTGKKVGWLAISGHNINELRDRFGATPKSWTDVEFDIVGERFIPDKRKGKDMSDGTIIHILKVGEDAPEGGFA